MTNKIKNLTFEELKEGLESSFKVKIGEKEMAAFSELTGDKNPLHTDEKYAISKGFKTRVVFGQLIQSYLSTLAGMYLPGKYSLILSVETRFRKPVYVGESIKITGVVERKIDSQKIIIIKVKIFGRENILLVEGKMVVKVLE